MKRDKPLSSYSYPQIKQIKPLFWRECRFCNKEFKRETGYKIIDYSEFRSEVFSEEGFYGTEDYEEKYPILNVSYCCNNCAKSVEDVKELIQNEKLQQDKLLSKPVPPPTRIVK